MIKILDRRRRPTLKIMPFRRCTGQPGRGGGAKLSHVLSGDCETSKGSPGHPVGSGRSSAAAPRAPSLKVRPMRAVLLRGAWLLSEGLHDDLHCAHFYMLHA